MATNQPTLLTPEFRGSFPALLEPRAAKNKDGTTGKLKYGITGVFVLGETPKFTPKAGPVDLTKLKEAVLVAAKDFFGEKLPALMEAGKFHSPFLKDPDIIAKWGYPPGSIYIRMQGTQRPRVVGPWPGTDGQPVYLTDQQIKELCFAGARFRASVRPFGYAHEMGNKGVSLGLQNLQYLGPDERWDNVGDAQKEFDAVADAADMPDPDTEKGAGSPPAPPAMTEPPKGKKPTDYADLL